jgi:hypothetical protein
MPQDRPSTPELIVRMGSHAEKDYILKLAAFLDGLMVGANLFESSPKATASLLVAAHAKDIQVFVDPMTYAFGAYTDRDGVLRKDLDWIKSEQIQKNKKTGTKETTRAFKRSYGALAKSLGDPIASAMEKGRAVSADDLRTSGDRAAFCRSVLAYQHDRIAAEFRDDDDLKDYVDDAPKVAAVFAPYFYIEPHETRQWLALNVELMQASARIDLGVPVHGIVCADVEHLLDSAFKQQVLDVAQTRGLYGIWLWFSRFLEDEDSEEYIEAYADLVSRLAKHVEVHSLHGGLFSMALSHVGMKGVSHGVGYGEQKDVLPVIGQSLPMVRYYLPALAQRLGVPQIERAFKAVGVHTVEDFYAKVCDCAVCRGVVVDGLREFGEFGEMHFSRADSMKQAQKPAAAKRCRFHFLLARLRERNDLRSRSLAETLSAWRQAEITWGAQRPLNGEHLRRWQRVLQKVGAPSR